MFNGSSGAGIPWLGKQSRDDVVVPNTARSVLVLISRGLLDGVAVHVPKFVNDKLNGGGFERYSTDYGNLKAVPAWLWAIVLIDHFVGIRAVTL